jgi:hypothetical protein
VREGENQANGLETRSIGSETPEIGQKRRDGVQTSSGLARSRLIGALVDFSLRSPNLGDTMALSSVGQENESNLLRSVRDLIFH